MDTGNGAQSWNAHLTCIRPWVPSPTPPIPKRSPEPRGEIKIVVLTLLTAKFYDSKQSNWKDAGNCSVLPIALFHLVLPTEPA
jgi:hypothetical protein